MNPISRLVVVVLGLTAAAGAAPREVDIDAVIRAGDQTVLRYATTPCAWETGFRQPDGSWAVISVLHSPNRDRFVFTKRTPIRRQEILRIISRDGVWYVNDEYGSYKYRPYEMPDETQLFYTCLANAIPRVMDRAALVRLGPCEAIDGNIATFSLAGRSRPQQATASAGDNGPAPLANGDAPRASSGTHVRIDLVNGFILEQSSAASDVRIHDFHFLDRLDERQFSIDGPRWEDHASDPTRGNADDLLLIGRIPANRPPQGVMEGCLLDLASGSYRRVPFNGSVCMPVCFVPGRKSIIVQGSDPHHHCLRPFQVSLATGANRPLGGKLLDSGMTFEGDLSPEGRRFVALHTEGGADSRLFQPCVIDLATNQCRLVGKLSPVNRVRWMPDGQHLLLVRKAENGRPTLVIMGLDGREASLCEGNEPVVLDASTVVFRSANSRQWYTFNLGNGAIKRFADGLQDYSSPCVSPDGKRLLMMHHLPGDPPVPTILAVGQSEGKPATDLPGLWMLPAWR